MSTQPNPKDSMKSTWRRQPKSEWAPWHWFFEILRIHPEDFSKEVPVHDKSDKVPHLSEWMQARWVLVHAFIPLTMHQAYVWYTGRTMSPTFAFFFYNIAFKIISIHELHTLRGLGHKYGFYDGDKHARDGVPDVSVFKVFKSLYSTPLFRVLMTVILTYRRDKAPLEMNWLALPFEIGLYGVVLDFWFYWYHRCMHDFGSLWQYHRTHHLTKHPNPLLTLYADTEQEIFDIVGIPLMTWITLRVVGFPMGFYEWWICHQFVVFAELAGHSGLRVHSSPPSTVTWILRYFNSELVIEDHDLHHRKGWKSSANYGKQTRLWDRIFGTLFERIESTKDNIDYENPVDLPLFGFH